MMLYAALLVPAVLMACLFVTARLERWLGRDEPVDRPRAKRPTPPSAPSSVGIGPAAG